MDLLRKIQHLIETIQQKCGAFWLMLYFSVFVLLMLKWNQNNNVIIELNQASLTTNSKSLQQIMAKQYDVPYGLNDGKRYKKILYWNSAISLPLGSKNNNFGLGVGRDRFKSAGCPVWQCETSEDRSNLLQYDAVIFNQKTFNVSDLPTVRSPHQRYIFFSHESPAHPNPIQTENETFAAMAGFFNWTMTYRLDSDIVHPYGWFQPINSSGSSQNDMKEQLDVNYAAGKTKMAAFFATNCYSRSGREDTVYELLDYNITVDLYGSCGNLTCGSAYQNQTEELCWEIVSKNYKFILAFYNSLCLDYIPERYS